MKANEILMFIAIGVMLSSCSSAKKNNHPDKNYTPEMQEKLMNYRDIVGFERRAIFLSEMENIEDEKDMKIEIIPGRNLYVDCNLHGISGKILKKEFDNGYPYYLFNSNGEIFSTMMECPDDKKTEKFVTGETMMVDYDSQNPIVVYTAKSFEVKYALWKAGEIETVEKANSEVNQEALSWLKDFPEKEGYVKKYILLKKLNPDEEANHKIEIMPGVTKVADCNNHQLSGNLSEKVLDGFGFTYFIFDSNGEIASTRMLCPDNSEKEKFITGTTQMIAYNSSVPIVVYIPKDIELKYRVWTTNGKMY